MVGAGLRSLPTLSPSVISRIHQCIRADSCKEYNVTCNHCVVMEQNKL